MNATIFCREADYSFAEYSILLCSDPKHLFVNCLKLCGLLQVAYFVEVQKEEDRINEDEQATLNPELRQLGVIAAVKVAVRSATMGPCSSRR